MSFWKEVRCFTPHATKGYQCETCEIGSILGVRNNWLHRFMKGQIDICDFCICSQFYISQVLRGNRWPKFLHHLVRLYYDNDGGSWKIFFLGVLFVMPSFTSPGLGIPLCRLLFLLFYASVWCHVHVPIMCPLSFSCFVIVCVEHLI